MSQREFGRTPNGYVFMSDERDIGIPYSKRQEVHDWAGDNGVIVEYQGTLGGTDVWRVKNEQQRAWFNLKWS